MAKVKIVTTGYQLLVTSITKKTITGDTTVLRTSVRIVPPEKKEVINYDNKKFSYK